jgi:hypothetical protein
MSNDDNNKVVKLRQPQVKTPAAGVGVGASTDDPINPKSLLNMTDVEQDLFLQHLRERRMRVAAIIKEAAAAKHRATSIAAAVRLEKKADQVNKQYERATKALDKLEELIYDLRALHLQYTDTDISKVTPDGTTTNDSGSKTKT